MRASENGKKYRLRILELSQKVSAHHIGGTFSCTEILEVIFNYFLRLTFYVRTFRNGNKCCDG